MIKIWGNQGFQIVYCASILLIKLDTITNIIYGTARELYHHSPSPDMGTPIKWVGIILHPLVEPVYL